MNLELKIPPLALFIACALLSFLFVYLIPQAKLVGSYSPLVAVILLLAGGGFSYSSILAVTQAKTTINPMHPEASTILITTGAYRVSRNPMYVGFILMLAGICIFCGSPLGVLIVPFFGWYLTQYQIIPEEKALLAKFSREYKAYMAKVRRWI